jgi:hypothetical protein
MWKVWIETGSDCQAESAWEYQGQDIWMQEMSLFATEVKFNEGDDIWYFLCNNICSIV